MNHPSERIDHYDASLSLRMRVRGSEVLLQKSLLVQISALCLVALREGLDHIVYARYPW